VTSEKDGNLRCYDVSANSLNIVNTMITNYTISDGIIFFNLAPQYGILSFP
jgi:hypothetical protein